MRMPSSQQALKLDSVPQRLLSQLVRGIALGPRDRFDLRKRIVGNMET